MKMHNDLINNSFFYSLIEICPVLEMKSGGHIDGKSILAMFVFYNSEVAAKG